MKNDNSRQSRRMDAKGQPQGCHTNIMLHIVQSKYYGAKIYNIQELEIEVKIKFK